MQSSTCGGLRNYVALGRWRIFSTHRQWDKAASTRETAVLDDCWSKAIAVGSLAFVDKVKSKLGVKAMHREFVEVGGTYMLREQSKAYAGDFGSESDALKPISGRKTLKALRHSVGLPVATQQKMKKKIDTPRGRSR